MPPFKRNLSMDQVIRPHGLDLATTRHILFGSVNTSGIRFDVYLFFPGASKASASRNGLSLDRQKDLYDSIIIPAAFSSISDPLRQELPGLLTLPMQSLVPFRSDPRRVGGEQEMKVGLATYNTRCRPMILDRSGRPSFKELTRSESRPRLETVLRTSRTHSCYFRPTISRISLQHQASTKPWDLFMILSSPEWIPSR
jgi:hypothetical protein